MSSSDDSAYDTSVAAVRKAIDRLARTVRTWSDEDLIHFINGDLHLELVSNEGSGRNRRRSATWNGDVKAVQEALAGMETREAGFTYLEELGLNRESLRDLAVALDLPATRADNVERLRNRIIESLIGYRLRSRAVRGKTLPPADAEVSPGQQVP